MARTKKNETTEKPKRHPLTKPYQLLSGRHYEPITREGSKKIAHKLYTTGDIVWSAQDLEKKFVNKFRRLRDDQVDSIEALRTHEVKKGAKKERRVVDRGNGRYDVIDNNSGQPVNEEYLSLEDAKYWEETGGPPPAIVDRAHSPEGDEDEEE
jgi:hypothetical protein